MAEDDGQNGLQLVATQVVQRNEVLTHYIGELRSQRQLSGQRCTHALHIDSLYCDGQYAIDGFAVKELAARD